MLIGRSRLGKGESVLVHWGRGGGQDVGPTPPKSWAGYLRITSPPC